MNAKRSKEKYSYKLKNQLKLKIKVKLWLRKINIDISRLTFRLGLKGNNFFSFFHITLILAIIAITVGSALIYNVVRANVAKNQHEIYTDFTKKNVIIHYGNEDYKATVTGGLLEDVIKDLNLVIDQDDEVFPDLSTPLEFVSECFIIKVDKEVITKMLQTDFGTIENITESEKDMESKVVRKGEKGEVLLEIELVYKNDILFSQTTIDKKVVKEPIDEIIAIYKTND